MKRRIRCLWHKESTASLVQHKDGWRCYGACNKSYTNKEVEERSGKAYAFEGEDEGEAEDLQAAFERIRTLPKVVYRGLTLPADEGGAYICWGDASYYKYRLFNPGRGGKYLSPKGHRPRMFWARRRQQ